MKGSSPLFYERGLCIIIAVVILLFLPLTFNGNNSNNTALAQTPHCDAFNNPANYDVDWCLYEIQVENYPWCVQVWTEQVELEISFFGEASYYSSPAYRCQLPPPPAPLQPLDCNQLQTCPTGPPICGIVPSTLSSQHSDDMPRIIHVQRGGERACKPPPLLINGCYLPMVREYLPNGKPYCAPAPDCPPGQQPSESVPKKCDPIPRWTKTWQGRYPEPSNRPILEHVCAAFGNIPWAGDNLSKLCEQLLPKE